MNCMRRLAVLLVGGLSLLSWLAAPASAGGSMGTVPRIGHSTRFHGGMPRGGIWSAPVARGNTHGVWTAPLVRAEPYVVIVPVPVATPVQVIAAPPAQPAAPPSPPEERVRPLPVVPNPGPKVIEIVPPPPGVRTVDIVVVRGSTISVEKVPVR